MADQVRGGRARPRHFSMLRSFHLADVFTLLNGTSGTAAIFLAMAHMREPGRARLYAAGGLVLLALVFDVLDGRVARWRHTASPLGRELDSLADVISFGVAPACLAYAVGMRTTLDQQSGYAPEQIATWAQRLRTWAGGSEPLDLPRLTAGRPPRQPRDVFAFFINGAKIRNPAAAMALIARLK